MSAQNRATETARSSSDAGVDSSCCACAPVLDGAAGCVETKWWQQRKVIALATASVLLLSGLTLDLLLASNVLATAFYLATVTVGGFQPARAAVRALRQHRLTINTLLVVATLGALALWVVEEAALLVVVFSLGEVLEEYAADRARGSIRALMALAPRTAHRQRPNGTTEDTPVETLVPGDVIVVRPGERLPTDGRVAAGASAVDQSAVTGESMPVEVIAGSSVYGGTLNGTGALEIHVIKEYVDTTLARIIRQVQEAQANRGRAQRFADRFGAVYTRVMFVLAALVTLLPPLVTGDFRDWLYRGLVVLTVSCSCALVISVPVSVVAAITRAARQGVLIKGGAFLEALAAIRAVAFDKTGTLTCGKPRLTDVVPLDGRGEEEVLKLAASIEASSEHPLASAILEAAERRGLRWAPGRDLRAIPGVGVEATVEGRRAFIGKPQPQGAVAGTPCPVERILADLAAAGKTPVVLADEGRPTAVIAVADEVRQGGRDAIASLRAIGVRRVVMLTGDTERTAAAIGRAIGIDEWRASLLPEDKTAAVRELRYRYGAIAMVGDGINDAPALAASDVGIAMGAAAADVALETADVALMSSDLGRLPAAIGLARRAVVNIRQNVVMSLTAVAILVVAALGGWLSLTSGLLLNEGSALLIIVNGLRLLGPDFWYSRP